MALADEMAAKLAESATSIVRQSILRALMLTNLTWLLKFFVNGFHVGFLTLYPVVCGSQGWEIRARDRVAHSDNSRARALASSFPWNMLGRRTFPDRCFLCS